MHLPATCWLSPWDTAPSTQRQAWAESTLLSVCVHNLTQTAACPQGCPGKHCDVAHRAGKSCPGEFCPQTKCRAEQICEGTEHVFWVSLQALSCATYFGPLTGIHHIYTGKVQSVRSLLCKEEHSCSVGPSWSRNQQPAFPCLIYSDYWLLICGVICLYLNLLLSCVLSRMRELNQIWYVLFTKLLIFLLRSLCFYSQSSGYKSNQDWNFEFGVQLKFSNLCSHLGLVLQLVCNESMFACFFLKGTPVRLMLPCGINPL